MTKSSWQTSEYVRFAPERERKLVKLAVDVWEKENETGHFSPEAEAFGVWLRKFREVERTLFNRHRVEALSSRGVILFEPHDPRFDVNAAVSAYKALWAPSVVAARALVASKGLLDEPDED